MCVCTIMQYAFATCGQMRMRGAGRADAGGRGAERAPARIRCLNAESSFECLICMCMNISFHIHINKWNLCTWLNTCRCWRKTLGHRAEAHTSLMRNDAPQDPTVGLCLGPYGGPRRGGTKAEDLRRETQRGSIFTCKKTFKPSKFMLINMYFNVCKRK